MLFGDAQSFFRAPIRDGPEFGHTGRQPSGPSGLASKTQ